MPAEDGAQCGPARGCDEADVCIGGACVKRDPPNGYLCASASPCQGEGRCLGSVCQRPPSVALSPSFGFSAAQQQLKLHDFVLEPSGEISLLGFFEKPLLRAGGAGQRISSTPARRCILWGNSLACADHPGSGKVSSVDPSSGQALWTFNFSASRPDLAALAKGSVFMARVAALGNDRLAAVFEGYPAFSSGSESNCRIYFLAILGPSGELIGAARPTDQLLDRCDHPHPFGVASDTVGNLFLAFSPASPGGAPLTASSPTLLVSYSRDGLLRWKRTESFAGGELAVARGLLFPERGAVALETATGLPSGSFPLHHGAFGRLVATGEQLIPAPPAGAASLQAHRFAGGPPSFDFAAPGLSFWSDQLRLAAFRAGPSEPAVSVVLAFAQRGAGPELLALNARHGNEEWSCPLSYSFSTPPQLFEVAQGAIAVMEGSDHCGACDPPFAGSKATFVRFLLPGLEVASEPWVGAFGGGGHDHQEDAPGHTAQR